jgi:hypothetical protein
VILPFQKICKYFFLISLWNFSSLMRFNKLCLNHFLLDSRFLTPIPPRYFVKKIILHWLADTWYFAQQTARMIWNGSGLLFSASLWGTLDKDHIKIRRDHRGQHWKQQSIPVDSELFLSNLPTHSFFSERSSISYHTHAIMNWDTRIMKMEGPTTYYSIRCTFRKSIRCADPGNETSQRYCVDIFR